jgi:hypothetical protein
MELLLILGALALVIMLALGLAFFWQQRRAGTVRAVIAPPPRPRGAGPPPQRPPPAPPPPAGDRSAHLVDAVEDGYQKGEIERSAYELARSIDTGQQVVVGVNRFQMDEDVQPELQRIDEAIRQNQIDAIDRVKRERDQAAVDHALTDVHKAAEGDDNLLVPMREALRRRATLQEVCDVLRGVYGGYIPNDRF